MALIKSSVFKFFPLFKFLNETKLSSKAVTTFLFLLGPHGQNSW